MKLLQQSHTKFFNRLSFRISALFGLTLLLSIIVIGYYGYKNSTNAYIENSIQSTELQISKLSSVLNGFLQPSVSDLEFLGDFYGLKRFIQWRDLGEISKQERWKNVTIEAFTSFLVSRKRYAQIRYINTQGKEMLRLDYDIKSNRVNLIDSSELQNKGHWDYFKKTMLLPGGTVYVSPFNLNRENGKIVIPHQPTIRFSTPMIDRQEQQRGMIVVNLIGNKVLEKFAEYTKTYTKNDFLLVNKQGFYLYHEDTNLRFGFDLGNRLSIANDYPLLFKTMLEKESANIVENNEFISFQRIHPSGAEDENYLIAIHKVPQSMALEKLNEFEMAFMLLVVLMIAGFIFIIRWVNKLLAPLDMVSQQLVLLSEGQVPAQRITVETTDEVGLIVKTSNLLIENTQLTINQLNAVSCGNFSDQVLVRSSKDELNTALNAMTKRLLDVARLAARLAKGDYGQAIQMTDSRDSLGIALKNMLHYLLEISKVAESIALGDFNYHYQLAGKNDRLGQAVTQMQTTLRSVVSQANAITQGDFSQSINPKSNKDELGAALLKMTDILASSKEKTDNDLWLNDGLNSMSKKLSNTEGIDALAKEAIHILTRHVGGAAGVIYFFEEQKQILELRASYAYSHRDLNNHVNLGDSVIGQVALERQAILLQKRMDSRKASATNSDNSNQEDAIDFIQSGTWRFEPFQTYTFPLIHENTLLGVAEVALMQEITSIQKDYLTQVALVFATVLKASQQNSKIKELLDKSQRDYEKSQMKSEELQQTNIQMEEQAQQLRMQADNMQQQNLALSSAKSDLDKQAQELIQASKYKSEFLANMSHELRTPLNAIILLSKMLRDTLKNKDQSKKAEVIHNAGNDLLLLINDILDLSKVEAGQMELHIAETSSSAITVTLQELFKPIAEDNELKFIVLDELNSSFKTDVTKVTQVLKNLLSNAFKFTKKGNVTLRLFAENNRLNFAVSDTGIGIPQDKLNHIFEAFKQVDGSISREYGGTGLGLSISLRFAILLGGELVVESKKGQGSTFILCLPEHAEDHANKALHALAADKDNKSASKSARNKKIAQPVEIEQDDETEDPNKYNFAGNTLLLVDNDSRNIFTLSALFQDVGAQTLHALNGLEALNLLTDNSQTIDLILMDIMMPKMDGYATIKKIRQNKGCNKIPIIAVTAKAMDEDRQKCLDAGANDYITKPVNEQTLLQLSRLWIDKMAD